VWVAAALAKNMAMVALIGYGFGLLVTRRARHGLVVIGASLALLALELGWVFPHWFPGQVAALNVALYPYLGHSTAGVAVGVLTHLPLLVRHVFSHPAYWLWIFGPVLGLALFGSASLWAVLALFALNAAAVFAPQQMVTGQYQLLLTAWLFLALVEALSRWPARRRVLLLAVADAILIFEAVLVTFVVSTAVVPQGPVAAARAAVATVPARAIAWTQNRLGPLLYGRPVFGVDRSAGADRALIDALPVLWAEAPHAPTALVATLPMTPLFGAVMARAERAGYRMTFHQGSAVVPTGQRHFGVPHPATTIADGYQPRGAWTEPAWAVRGPGTQVDWATGAVSRSTTGPLLGPLQVWATGPVRLTITFTGAATGSPGTLGWQTVSAAQPSAIVHLLWQGLSRTPMAQVPGALHRVPVVAASTTVSLAIPVIHAGWIIWLLAMPPGVSAVQIHWAPVSPATP
jgi:hypothetical protein